MTAVDGAGTAVGPGDGPAAVATEDGQDTGPAGRPVISWSELAPATPIDPRPRLVPLTARSVMLSVLLGSGRSQLPVRSLVRAAHLFGIAEGTARVALSRMNADGDVEAENGRYCLSDRLLRRQEDMDRGIQPVTAAWEGRWEMGVVLPPILSSGERAALGAQMKRLRLAELRPGVFTRPDNLVREWPEAIRWKICKFVAVPDMPASQIPGLVGSLWDLDGFDAAARYLLAEMRRSTGPAERFVVVAAMARLLREDPVLPGELLPDTWPAGELREAFDGCWKELDDLLGS